MYLDAMEFLEEERDTWAPFEALAALNDAALARPVPEAHGWSARDLMIHLVAWQAVALDAAKELAISETSSVIARADATWDERGADALNAEVAAAWADRSIDDLRDRFASQPGDLRGYLTVVPEARWLKAADVSRWFHTYTTGHYEDHRADVDAILAAAATDPPSG